jgi:hypothetical protein
MKASDAKIDLEKDSDFELEARVQFRKLSTKLTTVLVPSIIRTADKKVLFMVLCVV